MPLKVNQRKYGRAPYSVAVIHGGPGAPGEMAPVARELSQTHGVLEPVQTKSGVDSQVEELKGILDNSATTPVTLIGWSWGAWLAFIFSAKHPEYVKKLILVGCGPFEEKYAAVIMKIRLGRLGQDERKKLDYLMECLNSPNIKNKKGVMKTLGQLISKADSYQEVQHYNDVLEFQPAVYQQVWKEASDLRISGKLLGFGRKIKCPVVAIHGDYDPHPFQGVKVPLSKTVEHFKFYLLKNCGHHPWYEKLAKDRFFQILRKQLE